MSRFNFATVDSSAYAELSLRLGQIVLALIQPSASMESKDLQKKVFPIHFRTPIRLSATIRANCYKQRVDQLRTHLIDSSGKPLLQNYTESFKRQQATQESKSGKVQVNSAHSRLDGDALLASQQYPLIFFAEQFLARSLKILAQARSNLIRFDGSSMFDRNWVRQSSLLRLTECDLWCSSRRNRRRVMMKVILSVKHVSWPRSHSRSRRVIRAN